MNPIPSTRNMARRGFEFEDIVADLFKKLGYSVEREGRIGKMEIDLVLRRGDSVVPVEVAVASTRNTLPKLRASAERLGSLVDAAEDFSKPIIVIGSDLTPAAKSWSESQYDVQVWDLADIVRQANPFPDISQRMEKFKRDAPKRYSTEDDEIKYLIQKLSAHIEQNELKPSEYEKLCTEVFIKLFDPYLYGFQRQASTSDGSNRYDFISRIKSGNTFWDSLRQDFRTKAILFECKNYEEPIGPDQVYSTERYLFSGALRTVCILVARLGANEAAIRAAQGAMRETGKLLILLSNQDLIEMLKLSTQEGGPEDFLDKRIWDFIISLPR